MAHSLEWFKCYTSTITGIAFKRMKKAKIDGLQDPRDALEAIWIELLGMAAIANHGKYISPDLENPYTEQDISDYLERDKRYVTLCVTWLCDNGMVGRDSNGYFIVNWCKYQSRKSQDDIRENNRLRQKNFRDKHKRSNPSVTLRNAPSRSVTSQIDVDVDIERELDTTTKITT
jgi:hypothetical protein